MKKIFVLSFVGIISLTLFCNKGYSSTVKHKYPPRPVYMECSNDLKTCQVWRNTLHSSSGPLYINGSIVCTPNKKICLIGRHTMRSPGKPLFVTANEVCMPDKKTCTDGYSMRRSKEPLY